MSKKFKKVSVLKKFDGALLDYRPIIRYSDVAPGVGDIVGVYALKS